MLPSVRMTACPEHALVYPSSMPALSVWQGLSALRRFDIHIYTCLTGAAHLNEHSCQLHFKTWFDLLGRHQVDLPKNGFNADTQLCQSKNVFSADSNMSKQERLQC